MSSITLTISPTTMTFYLPAIPQTRFVRLLPVVFFLIGISANAQTEKINSLIRKCLENSVEAKMNKLYLQNAQANYWISLSSLKPQLTLNSNFPGLTRSINSITQPDGTAKFLSQSQAFSSVGMVMNQKLPFSGGSFYVSSGLNRLDIFEPVNSRSWQSSPFLFGFSQPLFQYNDMKRQKELAMMGLHISNSSFQMQNAQLVYEFTGYLFDHNFYQYVLELNAKRLVYLDETILHTSDLVSAGKIFKEEEGLLLIEKVKVESDIIKQQAEMEQIEMRLLQLLGEKTDMKLDLQSTLPPLMDSVIVLKNLLATNPSVLQSKMDRLNAQIELNRVVKNRGVKANLDLSVGLNQRSDNFTDAYRNLLDQEKVSVTISMPLLDGQLTKNQQVLRENDLKISEFRYQQDSANTYRQVYNLWRDYQMSMKLLASGKSTADLAKQRFDRYRQLFEAGKVSIDQLNQAELSYRSYEMTYLQNIVLAWKKYYLIQTFILG